MAAAQAADVTLVVVADTSSEGRDRTTLDLPDAVELVSLVAHHAKRLVVITVNPGPYVTPWAASADAILDVGLPGEQEGPAIVDLLFGSVNPGGKLPHTLPNVWNETRFSFAQYPGIPAAEHGAAPPCTTEPRADPGGPGCVCRPTRAEYTEKLEVGYRWYAAHGVKPAFAFGHGLSFTKFAYSDLTVTRAPNGSAIITATVHNTGDRPGAEVAQLYLRYPDEADEPFPQLRGFAKLQLEPGRKQTARFEVTARWLSIWDVAHKAWKVPSGPFAVLVGAASDDIRLRGELKV